MVLCLSHAPRSSSWYYLQGNFLYCYPSNKPGAKVKGVLYVEGATVCRHTDDTLDSKGYFGVAIHTRYVSIVSSTLPLNS